MNGLSVISRQATVELKQTSSVLTLLLLVGCFDTPIETRVDLERTGVAIDRPFEFRHADRYAYGFAFRPSFVVGDFWHVAAFASEESRAWKEFCPSIELVIRDTAGRVVLRDASQVASEQGWAMTNGTQDAKMPASVYKFITFTPQPNTRYRLTLTVTRPCSGANALEPHFFLARPMAGP